MKVPTIEDLIESEMKSIKENKEKLATINDWYEYDRLKKSISRSEFVLNNCKVEVRNVKLKQIGL